ncbi:hypothetical protein B0T25DRAFT_458279 [Lasiosphaeria hispida]|uniref:Pectate lyase superfamily protein domain-containing protein n=1 Tax=Lasiosphaeria hispida TaxID=260671 RepID=A0AAJ0HDS9_9PEZI|nr:hypothetical protein B0T25DRAFT_458279 [Lasiosphaeria hispida]
MLVLVVLVSAIVPATVVRGARAQSTQGVAAFQWTDIATERGDRLPNFSFCGYHASEQPLPSDATQPSVSLDATKGDQTQRIQDALDETAAAGGGVVILGEGDFVVSSKGLTVPSGVVLRGAGVGLTQLKLSELGAEPAISFGSGTTIPSVPPLHFTNIVDQYVPIGASQVTADNTTGLSPGDRVFIQRQVTGQWVRANGMGDLSLNGKEQTWLGVDAVVRQPREIKSIHGNTVTLDIPLTDALDTFQNYMSPVLVAFMPPNASSEMGVEHLSLSLSPTCSGAPLNTHCDNPAISFSPWTTSSWARNLEIAGFNAFVIVQYNTSRITLQNVSMIRDADATDHDNTDRALPADILIQGTQILVQDCAQRGLSTARSFAVMTGSLVAGPNAVLRHKTASDNQTIVPHQRWAHGFLVEDTEAQVRFFNRATNGTGHGWAINAGVGWNLRGTVLVQSPPLGVNWCVGCSGTVDERGNGTFVERGQEVVPKSLFEKQLADRKGK